MANEKEKKAVPKRSLSFFERAHRFFFSLALVYPVIIALLWIPAVQEIFTYQQIWRFPLFAKYHLPEKYSLAPGKVLNTYFTTPDNNTLGAWFVLPDPYYQRLRAETPGVLPPPTEEVIRDSLRSHPTILNLHGAAGTRATHFRVDSYKAYSSRLDVNVFAIDYRGFGDSTGRPHNEGLVLDAYTGWQWLIERGAKPEDIVIVGHSLGTGISGQLMKRLAKEGVAPRGVALLAPFSSILALSETYALFGIPLLQPLQMFSFGRKLIKKLIHIEFDTLSAVPEFNAPTLIVHSQDDMDIPYSHSQTLIDKLLDPLLPARTVELPIAPGMKLSTEEFLAWRQEQEARNAKRGEIVKKTEVENFGMIEEFKGLKVPVVYVETFWGTHARIGLQEGVQDQMARHFKLGPYLELESESSVVDAVINKLVS